MLEERLPAWDDGSFSDWAEAGGPRAGSEIWAAEMVACLACDEVRAREVGTHPKTQEDFPVVEVICCSI